jgi:hypothetical protein
MPRTPLQGIRICLSGAVPDDSSPTERVAIETFVSTFAAAVFREGGTLVHGSHPTFQPALEFAARRYVKSGGARDALTLVRAQEFARTPEQIATIDGMREYAAVQVIPDLCSRSKLTGTPGLISMREWMAERCDLVVAVGGNHYSVGKQLAGVPDELEEMLCRGKPGFILAGFGGAAAGYFNDNSETIFGRLRNGLAAAANRSIAKDTDAQQLVARLISQIKLLPLVREDVPRGRLFRILALDGGGLRGTFTAAVLAKWDDMLGSGGGNELVKHFDLVAGTSTGAILAIGLALGHTPLEMLKFYKTEGPRIFPKDRKLRHWLKSKHQSQTLRSILEAILGNQRLSDQSCCRLVIPTVRAIHGEAESIVTAHSADRTAFANISAVDAALASSAAPTYFDEAVIDGDITVEKYLDGGVWANNPVLPAIAEAVRYLRVPLDRVDVLSVGTMGNESDFSEALGKGKLGWAPTSADLFFAAQEHAAATLADSFLGAARHLRVNEETPIEIKLDDTMAIEDITWGRTRSWRCVQDFWMASMHRTGDWKFHEFK